MPAAMEGTQLGLRLPGSGGGPGRVLVVDDNELNRDLLVRRLQRDGHSVSAVGDGVTDNTAAFQRARRMEMLRLTVDDPGAIVGARTERAVCSRQ